MPDSNLCLVLEILRYAQNDNGCLVLARFARNRLTANSIKHAFQYRYYNPTNA